MIYAIEGRTNSGKDTIVRRLMSLGEHVVCSYTTRPMRPGEVDGVEHIFITTEEADKILETEEIVAHTRINNYEYFTTRECLNKSDDLLYIIDPNGVKYLQSKHPDIPITRIYIYADKNTRLKRAVERGDDAVTLLSRNEDEDAQFTEAECNHEFDYSFCNDGHIPLTDIVSAIHYVIVMNKRI